MSRAFDTVKRTAEKLYNNTADAYLSKALGFCFIKYHIEPEQDSDDIFASCVDGSNDRGFDYVYYDDSEDGTVKAIFIQCKYSENNTSIDETEVNRTISNIQRFPELDGNINSRLQEAIRKWYAYKADDEVKLEKVGYYLNFGSFSENALALLKSQAHGFEIEIFGLERFESEVLFDPTLPSFNIQASGNVIEYENKALIAIINIEHFFSQDVVRRTIESQKIFHHNVRGLMNYRKNSISSNIKETAIDSPNMMALRNNGITITCDNYQALENNVYSLENASIVNGQQTIRTLWRICDQYKQQIKLIFLPAKILKISSQNDAGRNEILNIAKSTNRQNPIKESDLRSNEPEQEIIQNQSELLPDYLKFKYITKRTVDLNADIASITKDEAILLLSVFIHQNPSDRVEGLYRYQYKKIFDNALAEHISIINLIRRFIITQHTNIDNNCIQATLPTIWKDNIYKKFRKATTVNYSLYLLSIIISKKYNYDTHDKRLDLVSKIYDKMKNGAGHNIENYFSNDFITAYNNVTRQHIRRLFDIQTITSDALRKECNISQLITDWDNFVQMKLGEGVFAPTVIV